MREEIKAVMSRVFEEPQIPDTISTTTCEKWDSLRHLNLTIELEMTFGVEFEPEEIATMKSLDQIEAILLKKRS